MEHESKLPLSELSATRLQAFDARAELPSTESRPVAKATSTSGWRQWSWLVNKEFVSKVALGILATGLSFTQTESIQKATTYGDVAFCVSLGATAGLIIKTLDSAYSYYKFVHLNKTDLSFGTNPKVFLALHNLGHDLRKKDAKGLNMLDHALQNQSDFVVADFLKTSIPGSEEWIKIVTYISKSYRSSSFFNDSKALIKTQFAALPSQIHFDILCKNMDLRLVALGCNINAINNEGTYFSSYLLTRELTRLSEDLNSENPSATIDSRRHWIHWIGVYIRKSDNLSQILGVEEHHGIKSAKLKNVDIDAIQIVAGHKVVIQANSTR
jgi:hypothetical protein